MLKVGVLTYQNGFPRGSCDFYPLIKWRSELKKEGIRVCFIGNHKNSKLFEQDFMIIDSRYFRRLIVINNEYEDNYVVIDLMNRLRESGIRVIFFENGDGAGSGQFDLIPYTDLYVKKQIYEDLEDYTKNLGIVSLSLFSEAYEVSEERQKKNDRYLDTYVPCPPEELHKIRIGWNIGMIDYRRFPLARFYPIGTNRLFNRLYNEPSFNSNLSDKPIDASFRGKMHYGNENYSFQRNKVVELFQRDEHEGLINGEFIPKNKYLDEMRKSKACVSPYGWGEVCYRDFEAVINGCVLIKPDMDHLKTWPDIFIKNETYVSLKWDMSDLEETLMNVIYNIEGYRDLVENAQQIYRNAITDSSSFISRFKNLLDTT